MTDEIDYTFGDAYPDMASKGTVFSVHKFAVQLVSLVRWRHGRAECCKFSNQSLPVEQGLAWIAGTLWTEHVWRQLRIGGDKGPVARSKMQGGRSALLKTCTVKDW